MTRRIPSACTPIALTLLLVLGVVSLRAAPAFAAVSESEPLPGELSRAELDDGKEVREPGDDDQPTIIGRRRTVPHAGTSSAALPQPSAGQPVRPVSKAAGPSWWIWVRAYFGQFVHILR